MQGFAQLLDTAQNTSAPTSATAEHSLELFGVTLVGMTPANGHKLVLTLAFIAIAWAIAWALRSFLKLFIGTESGTRFQFWAKQGVSLIVAAIVILGILSIWFDNPARLAGVLGLVGAGIAFALQRVITAVAGYVVILRGKTFNVGDRIMMGGVRGDVIDLSFMQTRIMEMGQSAKEQGDQPEIWVKSRQFTGRIVTVTNDKVFDCPVYNYTHEFPYIWDEINFPVRFQANREKVEKVLLEAARKHALTEAQVGTDELDRLEERFGIDIGEINPSVFWRITDNWLEITVRFLAPDHGVRRIKDAMSRDILKNLDPVERVIASERQEQVTGPTLAGRNGG